MLKQIQAALGISHFQFFVIRGIDAEFNTMFQRARSTGHETLAEEMDTIPDEYADVQRARLKCEQRRWWLSKVSPARYGDKLDLTVNERPDLNTAIQAARERALPSGDLTPTAKFQALGIPDEIRRLATGAQPVALPSPAETGPKPHRDTEADTALNALQGTAVASRRTEAYHGIPQPVAVQPRRVKRKIARLYSTAAYSPIMISDQGTARDADQNTSDDMLS